MMDNNRTGFDRDDFHKEIDLIQACITRMAQNSFMIKGWAFTLVTALIALTADKVNLLALCGIGVFIMLSFWCLDAFFLKQEKLFRFKYDWVIQERPQGNMDFMFNLVPTKKETWSKDADGNDRKEPSVLSVMFSKPRTLLLFYGCPIMIGMILAAYKLSVYICAR